MTSTSTGTRSRGRRGAVAGVVVVALAVVGGVNLWGGSQQRQPEPTGPRPTPTEQTGPRTVSLTNLGPGKTPPFDYIDQGNVFHGADGRVLPIAAAQTISTIGPGWVMGGAGRLVILHDTRAGYAIAVDDGQPRLVLPSSGIFEDYRELAPGPNDTVYMAGEPGHIVSVGQDGRVSEGSIPGPAMQTATRDYFWRLWQGRVWRLDPDHPSRGWTAMGRGQQPLAVYDADAVWVVGARCNVLHDADTYRELWRVCGWDRPNPFTETSPDGRYALVYQHRSRYLQVIEARTGDLALTIDAGPGRQVHAAFSSSWSGDDVLLTIGDKKNGRHHVADASCDVSRATCWQIELPSDARWIGPPLTSSSSLPAEVRSGTQARPSRKNLSRAPESSSPGTWPLTARDAQPSRSASSTAATRSTSYLAANGSR